MNNITKSLKKDVKFYLVGFIIFFILCLGIKYIGQTLVENNTKGIINYFYGFIGSYYTDNVKGATGINSQEVISILIAMLMSQGHFLPVIQSLANASTFPNVDGLVFKLSMYINAYSFVFTFAVTILLTIFSGGIFYRLNSKKDIFTSILDSFIRIFQPKTLLLTLGFALSMSILEFIKFMMLVYYEFGSKTIIHIKHIVTITDYTIFNGIYLLIIICLGIFFLYQIFNTMIEGKTFNLPEKKYTIFTTIIIPLLALFVFWLLITDLTDLLSTTISVDTMKIVFYVLNLLATFSYFWVGLTIFNSLLLDNIVTETYSTLDNDNLEDSSNNDAFNPSQEENLNDNQDFESNSDLQADTFTDQENNLNNDLDFTSEENFDQDIDYNHNFEDEDLLSANLNEDSLPENDLDNNNEIK